MLIIEIEWENGIRSVVAIELFVLVLCWDADALR